MGPVLRQVDRAPLPAGRPVIRPGRIDGGFRPLATSALAGPDVLMARQATTGYRTSPAAEGSSVQSVSVQEQRIVVSISAAHTARLLWRGRWTANRGYV